MILQLGNHQELAATQSPRNEGLIIFHRAEGKKTMYSHLLQGTSCYFFSVLYSYSFRGDWSAQQRSQP